MAKERIRYRRVVARTSNDRFGSEADISIPRPETCNHCPNRPRINPTQSWAHQPGVIPAVEHASR